MGLDLKNGINGFGFGYDMVEDRILGGRYDLGRVLVWDINGTVRI